MQKSSSLKSSAGTITSERKLSASSDLKARILRFKKSVDAIPRANAIDCMPDFQSSGSLSSSDSNIDMPQVTFKVHRDPQKRSSLATLNNSLSAGGSTKGIGQPSAPAKSVTNPHIAALRSFSLDSGSSEDNVGGGIPIPKRVEPVNNLERRSSAPTLTKELKPILRKSSIPEGTTETMNTHLQHAKLAPIPSKLPFNTMFDYITGITFHSNEEEALAMINAHCNSPPRKASIAEINHRWEEMMKTEVPPECMKSSSRSRSSTRKISFSSDLVNIKELDEPEESLQDFDLGNILSDQEAEKITTLFSSLGVIPEINPVFARQVVEYSQQQKDLHGSPFVSNEDEYDGTPTSPVQIRKFKALFHRHSVLNRGF